MNTFQLLKSGASFRKDKISNVAHLFVKSNNDCRFIKLQNKKGAQVNNGQQKKKQGVKKEEEKVEETMVVVTDEI